MNFAIFALADGLQYVAPQAPAAPDFGSLLVRLLAMTLFTLLICAALIWAVRFARRPRVPAGSTGMMRVVESLVLTGRSSVYLIEVGTARVLVAIDPAGLKSCHLVDDNFAGVLEGAGVEPPAAGPSVAEMMSLLAAGRVAA